MSEYPLPAICRKKSAFCYRALTYKASRRGAELAEFFSLHDAAHQVKHRSQLPGAMAFLSAMDERGSNPDSL